MKTYNEIRREFLELMNELEQIIEANVSNETEIDFGRLSVDAYRMMITPHPLEGFDDYTKKSYITLLLTVANFDRDKLFYSLLLVHRIAFGMKYLEKGTDLRAEYIAAQTLSYKQLDEIYELFKGDDVRFMLILECLLIVGAFNKGKKDALGYVANLSAMLKLNKEQLVFLSNLAVAILTQDLSACVEDFGSSLNEMVQTNGLRTLTKDERRVYVLGCIETIKQFMSKDYKADSLPHIQYLEGTLDAAAYKYSKLNGKFSVSDDILFGNLFYRLLVEKGFNPWTILSESDFLDADTVKKFKRYLEISKNNPKIFAEIDSHDKFRESIDVKLEDNAVDDSKPKAESFPELELSLYFDDANKEIKESSVKYLCRSVFSKT